MKSKTANPFMLVTESTFMSVPSDLLRKELKKFGGNLDEFRNFLKDNGYLIDSESLIGLLDGTDYFRGQVFLLADFHDDTVRALDRQRTVSDGTLLRLATDEMIVDDYIDIPQKAHNDCSILIS
ncbi:MAG TPA: hypothetical protein VFG32_00305 [Bacteroidota bacterium]|nr:hypothetical protein [Bacteroidota bacterium]